MQERLLGQRVLTPVWRPSGTCPPDLDLKSDEGMATLGVEFATWLKHSLRFTDWDEILHLRGRWGFHRWGKDESPFRTLQNTGKGNPPVDAPLDPRRVVEFWRTITPEERCFFVESYEREPRGRRPHHQRRESRGSEYDAESLINAYSAQEEFSFAEEDEADYDYDDSGADYQENEHDDPGENDFGPIHP